MIAISAGGELGSWFSETKAVIVHASSGHASGDESRVIDSLLDVGRTMQLSGAELVTSQLIRKRLDAMHGASPLEAVFWTYAIAMAESTRTGVRCFVLGTYFHVWRGGAWVLGSPPESIRDLDSLPEVGAWEPGVDRQHPPRLLRGPAWCMSNHHH